MNESLDETWGELGYGPGSATAPAKIKRSLDRKYGHRKKRLRLDWRVQRDYTGGRLMVYEAVRQLLGANFARPLFTDVLLDITCVDDDYHFTDILRAKREYIGASTAKQIAIKEEQRKADVATHSEAVRNEAEVDWDRFEKKRRMVDQAAPSGGF